MSDGPYDIKGDILLQSGNVVEWKVWDISSFPRDSFYRFESPPFSFRGSAWCLGCYPDELYDGSIFLYLKRKHSQSDHTFTFQVGIQTNSGTGVFETCPSESFLSNGFYKGMCIYIDKKYRQEIFRERKVTLFCVLPSADNKSETSEKIQSKVTDVANNGEKCFLDELINEESASTIAEGTERLSQSFKNIFVTGDHHDTIIKVQDVEFRTHKLILIVRSPVFESMFRHDTLERETNSITIEDCDPEVFKEFLSFLYSGKVENLSVENVTYLYSIADKYQVDEVKSQCVKFMTSSMSVESFCDFISLALRHSEKQLLEIATDYFARNAKKIIKTVQWLSFLKEHPVESNELNIKALTLLDPN